MQDDSLKLMVEIRSFIPGIVYDLRYATEKNFTGRQLYKKGDITYLRLPAARALKLVQQELDSMGMSIKIFDAYRPYHVTKKMWDLVQDERYVAHPYRGSNHNRGLAVDLTIIYKNTSAELDMGTGFDNFSDTAHHAFAHLPSHIAENRALLRCLMEKYGFRALETEWWHYTWVNDRNYAVLDLDFSQLERRKL